jgi:hypothetical protein
MITSPVKAQVNLYHRFHDKLFEQFPDLDDETIRDSLEGLTNLHEIVAAVIRSALFDEALQAALRARIDDMRQRLVRLGERGLKKRQLALEAMNEVGLKKLEQPGLYRLGADWLPCPRSHLRAGYSPGLLGAAAPKLDRQGLASDLKRGKEVSGACLGNANLVLVVRTK